MTLPIDGPRASLLNRIIHLKKELLSIGEKLRENEPELPRKRERRKESERRTKR
jgi:hypothetical protein